MVSPLKGNFWAVVSKCESMLNLGYCSMDLEDSPLDLSNGMLQIAAYLQHIIANGDISKIMNSVKMKLRT